MIVRRLFPVLLVAMLEVPAVQAQDGTRWMCWLGTRGDYGIHCLRDSDPVLDDAEGALMEVAGAMPPSRHDRSIGDGRATLESARPKVWTIPLYAPPFDLKDVELLASAVMCGSDAACQIIFARHDAQVAGN